MKNVTQLRPVYLNMRRIYCERARDLQSNLSVQHALSQLKEKVYEMANFKRQAMEDGGYVEQAHLEFALDHHEVQVRIFNWHWLLQTYEASDLADLQLAICRIVEPNQNWQIYESDLHSVVVNKECTLVADLKLCTTISAEASLYLATDRQMKVSSEAKAEANRYIGSIRADEQNVLAAMKADLAKFGHDASISPIVQN